MHCPTSREEKEIEQLQQMLNLGDEQTSLKSLITSTNRINDTSRETNPYKELIVNNAEKIVPLLAQMEQWSIVSNTLNCIQYNWHPKNYHSLGISAVNKCGKNLGTNEERDITELDFGPTPDILKEEYFDMYKGIQSEILNTTRFGENSRPKNYIFRKIREIQK